MHVEVIRYPGQVAKVISCVRTGTMPWREKLAALKQVNGEYEDLVSCQNLAHAIPTAKAKRNQPLNLDKPVNRCDGVFMVFFLYLPSSDKNLVGSKI